MNLTYLKIGLIFILALTTSCSTVSPGFSADTPDEIRTMREARLTYGIGGAIAGGLIANQLSKDKSSSERKRNTLLGAALGAGLGDAFGQTQGEKVVNKKRVAKTAEAQLRKDIADARKFNNALASYNSRLSREIASLKKSKSKAQANVLKKQSKTALREANSQLSATRKYIANPANSNGKSRMQTRESELKAHISKLERNRAELERVSKLTKV